MTLRHLAPLSLIMSSLFGAAAFGQSAPATKLPPMPKWQESKTVSTGSETAAAPEAPAQASTTNGAAKAPRPESKTFTSDGSAVTLDDIGFTITPPNGWEVNTHTGSLSMVLREPKVEAPDYDKPKYQRNITVAMKNVASPIDEKRAKELEAELTKSFTGDASVANFQIMEHKFFNFKGENDGLLVYSAMDLGDYKMMQMHVLVSGAENQYLMTYTDLADRFSDQQDPAFATAWSSIVSAAFVGETPSRINEMARYGAIAGSACMLLLVGLIIRRRTGKKDYASIGSFDDGDTAMNGDALSGSMISTLAQGWKIGKKGAIDGNDGLFFSSPAGVNEADFVSNF